MASGLTRDIAAKLTQRGLRFVQPVPYAATHDLVRQAYDQIERDFRVLAAPYTLHASAPPILAGAWSITRETLLTGNVDRSIKEVVATAVSKSNECPYCVGVHSGMLHAKAEHDVATAIRLGTYDRIKDAHVRAVVEWALATKTPDSPLLQKPPFSTKEAPEIIGTAVAFHYINRMVNVFLADSPLATSSSPKGWASKVFGATLGKRVLSVQAEKGDSLSLLPAAPLSPAFAWARTDDMIAGTFSRFEATLETAAKPMVSEPVRKTMRQQLSAWHGQSMGISSAWTKNITGSLSPRDAAVARLALLTAFASYQVDVATVETFRSYFAADEQLITLTAWSSFAAAKRVGSWLS